MTEPSLNYQLLHQALSDGHAEALGRADGAERKAALDDIYNCAGKIGMICGLRKIRYKEEEFKWLMGELGQKASIGMQGSDTGKAVHPITALKAGGECVVLIPDDKDEVEKLYPKDKGSPLYSLDRPTSVQDEHGASAVGIRLKSSDMEAFAERQSNATKITGFAPGTFEETENYIRMRQPKLEIGVPDEAIDGWLKENNGSRIRSRVDHPASDGIPASVGVNQAILFDEKLGKLFLLQDMKGANFGTDKNGKILAVDVLNLELTADDLERVPALRFSARTIETNLQTKNAGQRLPDPLQTVLDRTEEQDSVLEQPVSYGRAGASVQRSVPGAMAEFVRDHGEKHSDPDLALGSDSKDKQR